MLLRKRPVLCNYYVTYRCNAKCSFCDIWEKPSPYVTLEQVTQNLTDLKKLGVRVIDFTGGEPLLHRQLPEFLKIAKQLGFITTVTTNTLLYPKYASQLKGLVDMLHFSLDAADEEGHNLSRGVKCFDKLIESIAIAKSLNERPDILFTVNNENAGDLPQIYNNISKANNLMLILNPMFEYNGVGSTLTPDTLKILEEWSKKSLVYLNQGFIALRQDGGNHINKPVCKAGSTTVVISPENKLVLPCYHLGLSELPIEGNLYNLYHAPETQKLIQLEGRHAKCEGCVINCYMQPSMAVNVNKYWFKALPSTLKYNLEKGTWKYYNRKKVVLN